MLPAADSLKISAAIKHELDREAKDIIATIADECKKAHNDGKTSFLFNLPTQFNIRGNITNKKAQIEIYDIVCRELKNKGYRLEGELNAKSCKLTISWLSREEIESERQKMENIKSIFKIT